MTTVGFQAALRVDLDDLRSRHLFRRLRRIEGSQGPTVRVDGRDILCFCSNNYLGLASHPALVRAMQQAAGEVGIGASASRLISGTMAYHEMLEERLAAFFRTEAALVFSSGYLANLGTITTLVDERDVIYCDRLNHASLIDACRLSGATLRVYPHNDVERLRTALRRAGTFRRRLIITDGVFSMDGDAAPLAALVQVAAEFDAWLMVDDAHGGFVLGEGGRGTANACGVEQGVHIHMGTLSKALGVAGGYVAGSHALIETLINRARSFIYSTAPPPAVMAAAIAALTVVEEQPGLAAQALARASRLRDGLCALGFDTLQSTTQIIPIMVGDPQQAVAFGEALLEEDVLALAIRPPSVPKGASRLRVSVMATHTPQQIKEALGVFERVGRRLKVIR